MRASADMPSFGKLFAEDFDRPETAPEPEAIEPVYSAGDLAAAREAAWQDGREAGLKAAAASDAAATHRATQALVEQFAAECDAAASRAEQSAETIARLLLDSLAATFPALCARYGDAEVRSIVRSVLPALSQEPTVTVRAHPRTARAVRQEIARLDPDIAAHIETVECDAMLPGDVRIAWRNGSATRDAAALWQQVAEILAPAGLLRADAAIMETIDGG
jgi:flagellar biosynthesis/type III secretory pathway protein FliH